MTLDADGNIVACAGFEESGPGPMIYVFSPTGRVLETHPMRVDRPTNCCFGDADMRTLYVTTGGGHLFRARTDRTGWIMWIMAVTSILERLRHREIVDIQS